MYYKILKHRGETVTLATTVGFAQTRGIPPGMNAVALEMPSATLEQISVALTPRLTYVLYYDDSATTKYTDLTGNMTDRNTSTGSGSSFNSFAAQDFLYFGCPNRFRGVAVDVTNVNATASTATVKYWNGTAWTNITVTDGTAVAGATLAQDGLMTWTVPTDWATTTVTANGVVTESLYWARYEVGTTLGASVSVVGVSTLANTVLNSTNTDAEGNDYMLFRSKNDAADPYILCFDNARFGGIELKSASITSSANLNWLQVTW